MWWQVTLGIEQQPFLCKHLATMSMSSILSSSQITPVSHSRLTSGNRRVEHRADNKGYGHTRGTKTSADDLSAIFEGLKSNGLMRYSRALSGYIPSAEALDVIFRELAQLKASSPDLIYVLDRTSDIHFLTDNPKPSWATSVVAYTCLLTLSLSIRPCSRLRISSPQTNSN